MTVYTPNIYSGSKATYILDLPGSRKLQKEVELIYSFPIYQCLGLKIYAGTEKYT